MASLEKMFFGGTCLKLRRPGRLPPAAANAQAVGIRTLPVALASPSTQTGIFGTRGRSGMFLREAVRTMLVPGGGRDGPRPSSPTLGTHRPERGGLQQGRPQTPEVAGWDPRAGPGPRPGRAQPSGTSRKPGAWPSREKLRARVSHDSAKPYALPGAWPRPLPTSPSRANSSGPRRAAGSRPCCPGSRGPWAERADPGERESPGSREDAPAPPRGVTPGFRLLCIVPLSSPTSAFVKTKSRPCTISSGCSQKTRRLTGSASQTALDGILLRGIAPSSPAKPFITAGTRLRNAQTRRENELFLLQHVEYESDESSGERCAFEGCVSEEVHLLPGGWTSLTHNAARQN